jgi:hypothetical protein
VHSSARCTGVAAIPGCLLSAALAWPDGAFVDNWQRLRASA